MQTNITSKSALYLQIKDVVQTATKFMNSEDAYVLSDNNR